MRFDLLVDGAQIDIFNARRLLSTEYALICVCRCWHDQMVATPGIGTGMTQKTSHLVPLINGWQLWKWFRLRGAGFPAEDVLPLSAPNAVLALEELVSHEALCQEAVAEAISRLEKRIGEVSDDERKPLLGALRKLRRGKQPAVVGGMPELESVEAAFAAKAQAVDRFAAAYDEDNAAVSAALREFALDERFCEAVAWQNLSAFQTALPRIVAGTGAKKLRRAEQMVASYVQRYHLKNDTIGFFGPQGDGLLVSGPCWKGEAGSSDLKLRKVCFEHWAVATLADALAADSEIGAYAFPRRLATLRLEGQTLHHSLDQETSLSAEVATILQACDGHMSAREIAAKVQSEGCPNVDDESDVFEVLESLVESELITWTFPIQTATSAPEIELKAMLEQIPGDVGTRARQMLNELMEAKAAVGEASGDSAALARSLVAINETFERLTGALATRNPGQTYGSRAIVYEECRRDFDLKIGDEFVHAMAAPLELVLQSARWFTHKVAESYEQVLAEEFDSATSNSKTDELDFLQFWKVVARHFGTNENPSDIVKAAQAELRARWQRALLLDESSSHVERDSSELRSVVAELFAAPGPGWPSARYHSPDVLMTMNSPGDFDSGIHKLILGEIHTAVNTCGIRVFQDLHESRDEFIAARQLDLPNPAVIHVVSRGQASRADHVWNSSHNVDLELGATPSWRAPEQVISVGELVVFQENEQLRVRTRDNRWNFSIIEVLENYFVAETSGAFSFLPRLGHRPRVTIDKLVVGRETWVFKPEELAFRDLPRGAELFAAARQWARSFQLPSRVFVKIPEEAKPMYIDLESPVYIEILSRLATTASSLTVSEMLPDIGDAWLMDADGRPHVSELRFATIDEISWKAP